MTNHDVARILREIGSILEIKGENPFKVRAYENAARTIEGLSAELSTYLQNGTLGDLAGVGAAIEEKITELLTTGTLKFYEQLCAEVPPGVCELLQIPSLGAKKIKVLWQELGITSMEALRTACLEDRLLDLKGFGKRTQEKILEGIAHVRKHQGQYLLGQAYPVAQKFLEFLKECPLVRRASIAGSLRRWKEVVRDIDLLVSSDAAAAVMEYCLKHASIAEVIGRGDTKTSVRVANGMQIDVRVVTDEQFPYALQYFTGSKDHNIQVRSIAQRKGLKVNEYGIFRGDELVRCADESEFYAALGLPCVPPEMREGRGELDLPAPPKLLERGDLRGVFHNHSTWSDGTAKIEEMAEKARSMGLEYLGLSDHSKAAAYAGGLDEARLARQMEEVDRLNAGWKDFRILKGLECDILPNGDLDLTPEILGKLDFVIGSIHSRFDMPEPEMTGRICRAIANPHFDILGHATGRLLLERDGYKVNLERVIDCAAEHGKGIELNCDPHRLDLDWIHARHAKEKGVMLSINPDAHSTAGIENISYGVAAARRGWLEAKDVLNTRSADEALRCIRKGQPQ